jgi:hypothetical protein
MIRTVIATALWLLPVLSHAQWLNVKTSGIPRAADGKPNLTAPAPRTPDGKPDLSGLWQPDSNAARFNILRTQPDEGIFRAAAQALFQQRIVDFRRDDPVTNCLPGGPAEMHGGMHRIMQSSNVIAVLFENNMGRYRQIYVDGRSLPTDPNPTWLGYSVGHWEGDTLVVESAGFNDRTWLDRAGHPHSESLRVTERFRRVDFGHMEFQITYEDPQTLVRPLTLSYPINYVADTDMIESVCNESDGDKRHMVATANSGVSLSLDILKRYVGTYQFKEGANAIPAFMGAKQGVTLLNGRLYINGFPLVPQSETAFESTGASARFVLDPAGKATRLVLSQTEGDAFFDLVP